MAVLAERRGAGHKDRKVYLLAILLSVAPMSGAAILVQLAAGDEPITMEDFAAFLTINSAVSLTVIYLLQRHLLGERFRDLSFKAGKWWQDVLASILLTLITLVLQPVIIQPVLDLLPPQDMDDLDSLFSGLRDSRWAAVLFIGPVLLLGVVFEEVWRVFFLKCAWQVGPSRTAQWASIFLSALVFGLTHLYQGPAGMVTAGISGLVLAVYYRFSGRLGPMVASHYLHNAIQFVGGLLVF